MKKVIADVIIFVIFDILMTSVITLLLINEKITFQYIFLTCLLFVPFMILFFTMAINDFKKYKKGIKPVLFTLDKNKVTSKILYITLFTLFIMYILIVVSLFSTL